MMVLRPFHSSPDEFQSSSGLPFFMPNFERSVLERTDGFPRCLQELSWRASQRRQGERAANDENVNLEETTEELTKGEYSKDKAKKMLIESKLRYYKKKPCKWLVTLIFMLVGTVLLVSIHTMITFATNSLYDREGIESLLR